MDGLEGYLLGSDFDFDLASLEREHKRPAPAVHRLRATSATPLANTCQHGHMPTAIKTVLT